MITKCLPSAIILAALVACSPQLSSTEKDLIKLLDSYEANNNLRDTADDIGIKKLEVAGLGLTATVSAELMGASRKSVLEQIVAKARCPLTIADVAIGGEVSASFRGLPLAEAVTTLLAGEGIAVSQHEAGLTLSLLTVPAPATTPLPSPAPMPGAPGVTIQLPEHPALPAVVAPNMVTKQVTLANVSAAEAAEFLLALAPGSGTVPVEENFVDTGDISSPSGPGQFGGPALGGGASFGAGNFSGGMGGGGFGQPGASDENPNAISGIKFSARVGENSIILYGPAPKVARATQFLRQFDSPRDHILIEALVLEVDTQAFDSLKTQVTALSSGRWSNVVANFGSVLGGSLSFTNTAGANNPTSYSGIVDFLVSQNVARVITRPYVATLSGKPATVNITSDQYLLVQSSSAGATVTTPSSISAGVILKIVPTVMGSRGVRMRIDVEESSFGVPGENVAVQVDKNNATSEVQIQSGRSIIIGGLTLNRDIRDESGFPLLRHVPILNLLFSNQSSARRTQEVVAIVTPHIWDPSMKTPLAEPAPMTLESSPSVMSDFERTLQIPKIPGKIKPEVEPHH